MYMFYPKGKKTRTNYIKIFCSGYFFLSGWSTNDFCVILYTFLQFWHFLQRTRTTFITGGKVKSLIKNFNSNLENKTWIMISTLHFTLLRDNFYTSPFIFIFVEFQALLLFILCATFGQVSYRACNSSRLMNFDWVYKLMC